MKRNTCLLALAIVVILSLVDAAAVLRKKDIRNHTGEKAKRPFCNSFTGCASGKKRSSPAGEDYDDELSDELSEISRRILAEANLWEQLQDQVEMIRSLASQMKERPLYRQKRSTKSFMTSDTIENKGDETLDSEQNNQNGEKE